MPAALQRQDRARHPRLRAGLGRRTSRPRRPTGAPNVLLLAWDDLGFATMDMLRRPGRDARTCAASPSAGVKFSNFHTTALCSPTRASLLTGRNATTNGMATIAEFASGFPGISTRIPFESGFISEVLAEQGYNTYCVGKWHLTPGEECNLAAYKGRWPLGRGFERFYGWLGGETELVLPGPRPRQPPDRAARPRPRTATTWPTTWPTRPIEFIRDAKVIDPDKPFFMYLAPQAGHAPHLVPLGVGRQVQGRVRRGLRGDPRRASWSARSSWASLPEDTELSPINPHGEPGRTGPDGQPWPLLDTVRPWDTLSDDEKRLFTRMAEVFAGYISYNDDQLGRVLDYLEESGELDNTLIVVVSDNGASGEGGPNGSVQRVALLQRRPRHHRDHAARTSTSSAPRRRTTTTTPAGRGRSTRRSRTGSAGPATRAASPTCASCPGRRRSPASDEVRHQYVHAVDIVPDGLRPARHRAARGASRATRRARSRARASPRR